VTTLPLEECMSAIIDYRGKSPRKTSSGVPLITARVVKGGRIETPDEFIDADEYDEWMRRGMPQVGDVVITTEAPLGEVAQLSDSRIALAQRLILLRGKTGLLDNTYLKYLLMSDEMQRQLASRASGTTVVGIKQSELRKLTLSLPAIGEQEAIAAVLGALDDKIEQNRRTGRSLEELARATFKAWFVDFEPVKARAAGQTSFPGMPTAAFAALPDRLIDSPLGPVPQGWEIRPIGDLVTVKGGGTPSTKVAEYWDGGIHFWATPKDLSGLQDPVLLETSRRITDAGAECISSGVLQENTVLLSSRAPVGYTALVKVPVAVNQGFIAMTCDGPLPPHYVLHWTRSMLGEIKSRASGTTFPEISKGAFRPIPAILPSAVVVQAFENFTASLFDLIEANARQRFSLEEMRNYLLPRLLSGAVSVRL
jgi:type I restriction enzyme, S subunit